MAKRAMAPKLGPFWLVLLLLVIAGAASAQRNKDEMEIGGKRSKEEMTSGGRQNKDKTGFDEKRNKDKEEVDDKKDKDCACIFGFDSTLYLPANGLLTLPADGGQVSFEAVAAITECKDRNVSIGVATGNCFNDTVEEILQQMDPQTFNRKFLRSPQFQSCELNKTIQLDAIVEVLDVEPNCAMFFDDSEGSSIFASIAGTGFQKVDPNIGVTRGNVVGGLGRLPKKCDCSLNE